MKNLFFLKAGALYFLGNIFDKAVAFITIPVFTRLLTTADYGICSTYTSWVSVLTVIITLSLGNSIRTASVEYKDHIDEYISSIFFLGTCSGVIITVVIAILSLLFNIHIPIKLILACCVQSYAISIISAVKLRYMMDVQYIKRTLLQCLPNLFSIIISIMLIQSMASDKYLGKIVAGVLVEGILGVLLLFKSFIKGRMFYNKEYWMYGLGFSLPLIFHSLSVVVLSQSDRTMITMLFNPSETGLYSLAYQFGMVPAAFIATIENIWIPWFTKKMESKEKNEINRIAIPYVYLVSLICTGVMLIAPDVLKFMTNEAYYDAIYMIAPVCLATFLMFLASISLNLEYYLKKTRFIALNTIVAAIINIALNLIFVPRFGGMAAAYTTVASYAVSFILHYLVARKLDSELFNFKIYLFPILILVGCTFMVTLLIEFTFLRCCIAVLVGVVFLHLLGNFVKNQ